MMYEIIAFYLFSFLTITMFCIVVFSKNALYSMTALAGGMIFISGFFFLLDADFLGVVQIIVYSGAVMAVYAFGMIFIDTTKDVKEKIKGKRMIYSFSIAIAILLVVIVSSPIVSGHIIATTPMIEGVSNPKMVGYVLFTKYLVPFELTAVMLLVAMVAGIVLVSKKMDISLSLKDNFEAKGEFEQGVAK